MPPLARPTTPPPSRTRMNSPPRLPPPALCTPRAAASPPQESSCPVSSLHQTPSAPPSDSSRPAPLRTPRACSAAATGAAPTTTARIVARRLRRTSGSASPLTSSSVLTVFTIHGFNTYWLTLDDGGYRALQTAPFCYDEEVFQALDFVVSEARRHKMRLILSLCNNWEDYGGKVHYVRLGNEAAGLDLTSDDDFFSDLTIKSYYKAFVEEYGSVKQGEQQVAFLI
ncbi:mannan endo-1,4-beta-mannosidase 1 isoform X2 [Brachypodium distachyon]|uniref:mannan endo-1,4-beta-mannosidase n=1 Tax=Brachypodium distachyon TaxID=15368 RepID=A0A2K2DQ22_BRADI|nr:mannan endo-1,4-beta-mannosidase 1 isoform X2 [Brachypodium distachyon]PNT76374.1 hypothetical protein BRADI_1g47532v3 [Brachypodium distachyon]|eukprot:XP_024313750.1 mannan endo-1,4-beta-mannosidase 1 isoform X2 [Brachypodium distachyon]